MNGYWVGFDSVTGLGHLPIWQIFENGTHANPSKTSGDNLGGTFYWGQFHSSGHWSQPAGPNQWVLMSMDGSPSGGWDTYAQYANVFLNVGTGIAYALNYHYSDTGSAYYSANSSGYWSQAHSSVSNDGKIVIYNSNMLTSSSGGRQDVFLVEVPSG
jgi:hypothetical protein